MKPSVLTPDNEEERSKSHLLKGVPFTHIIDWQGLTIQAKPDEDR